MPNNQNENDFPTQCGMAGGLIGLNIGFNLGNKWCILAAIVVNTFGSALGVDLGMKAGELIVPIINNIYEWINK